MGQNKRRLYGVGLGVSLAWVTLVGLPLGVSAQVAAPPVGANVYADALARGNTLLQKKDYSGAVRAFEAAVAAKPTDSRALSELSWAAILAGEYTTARTAADKSIATAPTPGIKASSYYNLGRVKEATGDRSGASAAYTASLQLRESKEVRSRLALLGGTPPAPSAAAAADPLVRHPLLGPYGQLSEFCAKQPGERNSCEEWSPDPPSDGGTFTLAAPFLELKQIKSDRPGVDVPQYHFALRLAAGWYVFADALEAPNRSFLELKEIRPVGGRLLVSYLYEEGRFDTTTDRGVIVCGLDAERRPSCIGPVATARATNVHKGGKLGGSDTTTIEFSCRAELLPGDVWQVQDGPKQPFLLTDIKLVPVQPGACAKQPFFARRKLMF